jgi:muramoyltetrapeptide carboxypeptidase
MLRFAVHGLTFFLAFSPGVLALSQDPADPSPLKPPALRKGDTIALVAPASGIEEAAARKAVETLQKAGYRVKLFPGFQKPRGYLASSDEARAAEINSAFADPEARAIFCLRGGYGTPRILDRLDYDLMRRNPKILVGYSDITALLNAVQVRTGLVVFHGPMGKELSAEGGLTPFSERHFWEAFRPSSPLFEDWGRAPPPGAQALWSLSGGTAEGVLSGGNLSVIASTVGTPYEPRFEGAVLFLEDVSEKPFRIDRMLNQLRLAGKLARVRAVLLGQFTGCEAPEGNSSLSLDEVFRDYFAGLGVPVLAGFPAGHVADQATLPLGVKVLVDATAKRVALLEAPVAE